MKPLKFWSPNTFEISSFKYSLDTRINMRHSTSGGDTSGNCQYTYNELGFRGDSPKKDGFKIMSIGCSVTEGVGVNDNQTWSHNFSKLIPNGVDLNFGFSGRSNDYISRCLISYYDYIKPDLVLIMYTSPQRREIYTKDGGVEPFMTIASWGYMSETEDGKSLQNQMVDISNDYADIYNWYKNHLLIKYFLESKGANWIWNGAFLIPKELNDINRYDGFYNNYLDYGADGSHPGPKHNKTYANNLYWFIENNFPEYISKGKKYKDTESKNII
jgi:hypothetical protein